MNGDVFLGIIKEEKTILQTKYVFFFNFLNLFQFANMFENLSSSEWLLYISEWQYCNNTLSNIRVTTKVAVNSLLSDNTSLQDRGSAILHNLACKEVKSVVGIPSKPTLSMIFCGTPVWNGLIIRFSCPTCNQFSNQAVCFSENEHKAKPAQNFATWQCF